MKLSSMAKRDSVLVLCGCEFASPVVRSKLRRMLVAALPATMTGFGANSVFRSGAPRSMKMGNILSPWRYDVGAFDTLP
jgi:hypothetical protein